MFMIFGSEDDPPRIEQLRISLDRTDLQVLCGGGIVGVPSEYFAKYGVKDAPRVLVSLQDVGLEVAIHTMMLGVEFPPNEVLWKNKQSW